MESTFVWNGVLKRIDEWEVRLLSTEEGLARLMRVIEEMHPYELGEVAYAHVVERPRFAKWVRDCVGQPIGDDIEDTLPDGDDGR